MSEVAVQRGDGFGYQLAARMLTECVCDKLNLPYVHNKIPPHKAHNRSQYCMDYAYYSITGKPNTSNVDNKTTFVPNFPELLRKEVTDRKFVVFNRDSFKRLQQYFIDNNTSYHTFSDNRKKIVIHIRRGDIARDGYGRCLDDSVYADIITKYITENSLTDAHICIETDSPGLVKEFATDFSAEINPVSEYAKDLQNNPPTDFPQDHEIKDWNHCIYMLQSLYNMATADVFIPSRSSFSVVGGLLSRAEIVTNRTRRCTKSPELLFPATADELNISPDAQRVKCDVSWLHYVPLVNPYTIEEL